MKIEEPMSDQHQNIFVFKTNIRNKEETAQLETLSNVKGIMNWSIDLDDCDNILRVEGCGITSEQIIRRLDNLGYSCEEFTYDEVPNNPIQVSTDKSKLDVKLIHYFLSQESHWANGRSMDVVKRSIDHSLCFGVYLHGNQIGFARVATDFSIFAWIMDVFILPDYRGHGFGKKLMNTIMNHDQLKNLKRWGLTTGDAHGLYKQYGFKSLSNPQNMMEIANVKG